jgi:hypothetical protein
MICPSMWGPVAPGEASYGCLLIMTTSPNKETIVPNSNRPYICFSPVRLPKKIRMRRCLIGQSIFLPALTHFGGGKPWWTRFPNSSSFHKACLSSCLATCAFHEEIILVWQVPKSSRNSHSGVTIKLGHTSQASRCVRRRSDFKNSGPSFLFFKPQ